MSGSFEFRRAIPVFPAPIVAELVAFYRERLGFDEAFLYDDYGGVRRGPIEIHFWKCEDRKQAENTSCRVEVDGVEPLYTEYLAKGIVHPNGKLELKPWGFHEFSVADSAGNLIVFAQRAPDYRA